MQVRTRQCLATKKSEEKALEDEKDAIQDKNATDAAAKLDADIKKADENIRKAGPVLEADSQGSALARLFNLPDTQAATLSTYQNLAMAVVIELLFVISLVASEVLEHHETKLPAQADVEARSTALGMAAPRAAAVQVATRQTMGLVPMREELEPDELQPFLERPKPVRQITSQREPFGNVIDIVATVMEPGSGCKVEIKEAYFAYARVCKEQGKRPFPPDKFAAEIKRFCKEARVKIHAEEHGVYLLNVRLKTSESRNLRTRRHDHQGTVSGRHRGSDRQGQGEVVAGKLDDRGWCGDLRLPASGGHRMGRERRGNGREHPLRHQAAGRRR